MNKSGRCMFCLAICLCMAGLSVREARAESETVDGQTWEYTIADGQATVTAGRSRTCARRA